MQRVTKSHRIEWREGEPGGDILGPRTPTPSPNTAPPRRPVGRPRKNNSEADRVVPPGTTAIAPDLIGSTVAEVQEEEQEIPDVIMTNT